MKNKNYKFLISITLFFIILISVIRFNSQPLNYYQTNIEKPNLAGNLEGAENILITTIERIGNVSGYGVLNLMDKLTIQNNNNNPIDSILFGIPLIHKDDIIYYEAYGSGGDSLVIERNNILLEKYEMLIIYLNTPLLPYQSTVVTIYQTYKNLFTYDIITSPSLQVKFNFTFTVWPILPYRAEGTITSVYNLPDSVSVEYFELVDDAGKTLGGGSFEWDISDTNTLQFLAPLLGNLEDSIDSKNGKEYISMVFQDSSQKFGEIHVEEIKRNIRVSPWGIIKVEEELKFKNYGYYSQSSIFINIPSNAKNVNAFDDLGELSMTIGTESNNHRVRLEISLIQNRAPLSPLSEVTLQLSYNLPSEEYLSTNWLEQSLSIDLLTSQFEYLAKKQSIFITIEGCGEIVYLSEPPIAIKQSESSKIIEYFSEYVSPIEEKFFLITYSIDLFDLLLRPLLIMLAIAVLMVFYIVIVKSKKSEEEKFIFTKEYLPITEIREFCSLYEEKNALTLEIRKAEEETKRKKLAKKSYKNIFTKNTAKIEQIKGEILPFKKILIDTNETFNNIIRKLDLLDAERISIDDSLNLLENRYKRGKLPSKAAYEKLANDFLNRRKKIDRTIDRYIQQLRSYLL